VAEPEADEPDPVTLRLDEAVPAAVLEAPELELSLGSEVDKAGGLARGPRDLDVSGGVRAWMGKGGAPWWKLGPWCTNEEASVGKRAMGVTRSPEAVEDDDKSTTSALTVRPDVLNPIM
jgi:hypothetical protein